MAEERELILKLGKKITDRIPYKLGMEKLTVNDPEYWGLAGVVTDEMAEVALCMDVRKPITLPKLAKKTKKPEAELEKLLMSDHPERAELLFFTGIIPEIFDGCPQVTAQESLADMLAQLCRSPKQHYVRWSLFLGGLAYEGVLKSLKFDNKTIRICEKYHAYRQEKLCADKSAIRHLAVNIGSDIFFDYLDFRQAVGNEDPQVLEQVRRLYQEIVDDGDALSLKELAVNGKILSEYGIGPGAEMGRILNELFDLVLTDAGLNEKEMLLKIISSKKTS